jgi:hypothetical protein
MFFCKKKAAQGNPPQRPLILEASEQFPGFD